jgi:hypothetical protein
MTIKTYRFEDGKYEFDRDSGVIKEVRRNGVHWDVGYQDFQFSKVIHAMLNYIDELEAPALPRVPRSDPGDEGHKALIAEIATMTSTEEEMLADAKAELARMQVQPPPTSP